MNEMEETGLIRGLDTMLRNVTRTTKQNKNLAKLAKYLVTLPENYSKFDMGVYNNSLGYLSEVTSGVERCDIMLQDCNTVGCAVGHGPVAGIPVENSKTWQRYSKKNFTPSGLEDDWLFSGEWTEVDKNHTGAAKRIATLLEKGQTEVIVDIVKCVILEEDEGSPRLYETRKEEYFSIIESTDMSILDREEDWVESEGLWP